LHSLAILLAPRLHLALEASLDRLDLGALLICDG
jgi:hypothetical protein